MRNIKDSTSFNLIFHNLSDQEQTYTFDDLGGGYTEQRDPDTGVFGDVQLAGARVNGENSIIVAPNSTAKFTYTLKLTGIKQNQLVEGYVHFAGDNGQADLSVPYLGYYGDMTNEHVFDKNANEDDTDILGNRLTNEDNYPRGIADEYSLKELVKQKKKDQKEYKWQQVAKLYESGEVAFSPNVTALGSLNVNNAFTIEGSKKDDAGSAYSLSLGSNSIVNTGNLTLANVTINGSILGNGQVNIAGNVTSNVDAVNAKTLTNDQLTQQIGNIWRGADTRNWKAANIQAAKLNVAQGASLTINHSITGDGITQPNYGSINVGINGKLNINLKDGQTANRANEQNISLDNANAGVRILDNGTFTTDDSAAVNINAGHGRAIVIDEPFGGRVPVQDTILAEWENGRTGDRSAQAARHRNTMTLGNSTQMKLTGRGGILLGYTATLTTGDHSIIHIDNQGNGEGLLLDANSKVEVSPHSQLLMTSNGKDKTGSYDGGNYIGMGQDGQFRVEHDATFRYKLINAGNGMDRSWADNFNIISQNVGAHPEVYVGNDAVFDGQSDYSQFNGEIFSFSLDNGSPKNEDFFTIDGAKYVNWQRNAVVPPVPGPVGGTSPQGNLYYSMARSIIGASGKKYYIFKWNNANLNGSNYTFTDTSSDAIKQSIDNFKNSSYEWWSGIDHLATSYSRKGNAAEAPGHDVSASDITGVDTTGEKHGIPVNKFSSTPSDDTGFDPKNSQRLVLVATIIPTQVDDTQQTEDPYQVQVKYVDNLAPGQAELHQKGINGLVRTTKTTYYNVDPATGEKTIDTSKGIDGHSVTTTVLNKKRDERSSISVSKAPRLIITIKAGMQITMPSRFE
ncbi:Fn3-like domain-containing protein [Lactobacillus kefiranofaciens]|uniref:Fn3-like domain-containing protein n=1 Tax=Lactobacillus kefiranofaciens TaxID=267818 RepID=A0AAX3UGE9_9LACO|nr:Fn3-like domain-containing protein [Lactobacillus kefiranofaciens]KRM21930.1 mlp [Lactobacillus kefiranofaciens subsp. kefiranofaciens DSM 5016 = JCM 6985]QFQ67480.1 hypothetical protein LKK75_02980 [Lactobacillus kefiranofaciens subsp. kefiranofaciens]WGO86781.1 Fn3-like domain-containing protein [Lactobacillus kefiranofaciens]WQH35902.1 Fn3-like domain-containing protein [Lactobacillus kefiranofaciens]SDA50298.1 Fn3-like domain-containing protein [Lactobacillus kefiranofaciens]